MCDVDVPSAPLGRKRPVLQFLPHLSFFQFRFFCSLFSFVFLFGHNFRFKFTGFLLKSGESIDVVARVNHADVVCNKQRSTFKPSTAFDENMYRQIYLIIGLTRPDGSG